MYLTLYAQYENVVYPYFQQFLYWSTSGFILVSYTVVIYLFTLKYLLIRDLALALLCASQMLIQITAISNLLEVLMILGFKAGVISLYIYIDCRTFLTMSNIIEIFVSFMRYEIPKILRYDFD